MPLQYVSAIASAIVSLTKTKQLQQEGLVKAWWFRSLAITLVIQLQFDIKLRASPNQIRTGLPNVRPPGLFYAAPGPFSKNLAGCENYYRYLLIVHFHFSIADFLFCSFELPVC